MVDMYALMERIFPICRSLTGNGNRQTLAILSEFMPALRVYEVPTGTPVFDWVVPNEWNCKGAYIEDPQGVRIVDFKVNNLHVLGYSQPVDVRVDLEELQQHLYSLQDQPDVIPYVTSYYKERWGFCLADKLRKSLCPGLYHCVIDSKLEPGSLTLADAVIPGDSAKEVLFSSYICHPSMANNECSGPCVMAALYDWISAMPRRRYTYRFVLAPETIGSIAYISKNLDHLKRNVVAAFNLTCVGDNDNYSFLPSRNGDTLADRAALKVLQEDHPEYKEYTFFQRGSDERQYCAPGVDLPMCSIMRTKYGEFPEYHTSADNLQYVTSSGLQGSFEVYSRIVEVIESNERYRVAVNCEPQLGKRGLYPTISHKGSTDRSVRDMMNFLAYADGTRDLISMSDFLGIRYRECQALVAKLAGAGLLSSIGGEA